MNTTPLTGFIIHSRPYQEKRAIYQLFSQEWGVVHGVGSRGVPSFVLVECFATGQNSLKTLSQLAIKDSPSLAIMGQNRYALLYINELIYKLIAQENPCPTLWQAYQTSVYELRTALDLTAIKQLLRQFEIALFAELGASIEWRFDHTGTPIGLQASYEFVPNQGFVLSDGGFLGQELLACADGVAVKNLAVLGQIHRTLIDFLLDYQPLHSRKLWAEHLKYH